MEIEEYVNKQKNLYELLISFIDDENDSTNDFQN